MLIFPSRAHLGLSSFRKKFVKELNFSVQNSNCILNVNFCCDTKFERPRLSSCLLVTAKHCFWTDLLEAQAQLSVAPMFLRLRVSEAKRKSLYCSLFGKMYLCFWGFERAKRSEKVKKSLLFFVWQNVFVFLRLRASEAKRSEAKKWKSLLFFVWQNVFVFFLFSRFRDICLAKFLWKAISPSLGWLPQNFFRRIFRKTLGYILAEKIFRNFFPLRRY